ncbi:MAG: TetR/AcrR family transcriptional regulator [Myxococcota bacterium]
MGYSQEHINKTRRKILEEAGRLMRQRGYHGVSIGAIMEAAELTHGGFYAHFDSKEQLFEAMAAEDFDFTNQVRRLLESDKFDRTNRAVFAAENYLDPSRTDKMWRACTMAASSQDVSRAGERAQEGFTERFRTLANAFSEAMGGRASKKRDAAALAALATCIGGLTLAQALTDDELSEALLGACLDNVKSLAT